MRALCFVAAAAILALAPSVTMAQENVYPRTYTDQDCRDFDRQIDDAIRFGTFDAATIAWVQAQRSQADQACYSGQYAAGARQLRDVLDNVIAASHARPVPVAPASVPAAPAPAGTVAALPPGSWREGCVDAVIDNGILHASCVDPTGHYLPAQLDLGACHQPVSNRDGYLACGEPGRMAVNPTMMAPASTGGTMPAGPPPAAPTATMQTVAPPPAPAPTMAAPAAPVAPAPQGAAPETMAGTLPAGNWFATCRTPRMIGSILQAECQDRAGMWRLTAIDTRGCHQPIANRNGGLSCY